MAKIMAKLNFFNLIKGKKLTTMSWHSTNCVFTFVALTLTSLNFGLPLFWLGKF